jgi:hypothetical protein
MDEYLKRLVELAEEGRDLAFDEGNYYPWVNSVIGFLAATVGRELAEEFTNVGGDGHWSHGRAAQVSFLEGLALKIQYGVSPMGTLIVTGTGILRDASPRTPSNRVFVVHGHDEAAKESVARFLTQLKLDPIILHEQPNGGRTIIEKFEAYADVGFAVILMTPDDVGGSAKDPQKLSKRARQNVILELGYFAGRIGRQRVCALHKPELEIPSDFQGVVFVPLDEAGGWKVKLAQELTEAKISIDLPGLLGTR